MNHLIWGGGASARRLPLIALTAIALAGAVIALAFSSHRAVASTTSFCNQPVASYDHCDGPNHGSFTGTQAAESNGVYYVCAAAVLNGSFYAGYVCNNGFAEHCYDGTRTMQGRIHNSVTFGLQMGGVEYWAGETCP